MQVDIGFGDAVTPGPTEIEYPTLLQFPAPKMLAYNRETVVAEKFQAMVLLGMTNSRMKDFFDVWSLARKFSFQGPRISQAVRATFQRRKTEIPRETPLALSEEFAGDATKNTQWQGFLRKGKLEAEGTDLAGVVQLIASFLTPVLEALSRGEVVSSSWNPPGLWTT